jgi:hypothetical protein
LVGCPSCGSDTFGQVAPNWVECRATLQRRILVGYRPIFEPDRYPEIIGQTPIFATETVTCRVRHHRIVQASSQNGPWPLCECGTFAIGVCQVCANPTCGDDSTRIGSQRVCLSCKVNTERRRASDTEQRRSEQIRRAEQDAEERQRAAAVQLGIKAEEMAEEIAQHGPCRAYPKHPASHTDAAGNCRACVIGLR